MNEWLTWGGHPAVHRLGWTLLHFLWQGALVAGLFAFALMFLPKRSSNARYAAGCLALLLMLAAPVITFVVLAPERTIPAVVAPSRTRMERISANPSAPAETASPSAPNVQDEQPRPFLSASPNLNHNLNLNQFLPTFVLAWLLGVSALSLRLLCSSLHIARLKRRGYESLGEPWITQLHRLKAALQISRPVRLVKSALVEVPAVVGWLRPVILLPAATLAGLTPAQLESILAHELAHVRRHDYLVNLLQNALETLLFYHSAVWWVSSRVRAEREICCDEIAVQLCGDRLVYAQALTTLEQLRAVRPTLALGADGSSLLERIRRLSGAPGGGSLAGRRRAGGVLMAALLAIIVVALLHHPFSNAKAQSSPPAPTNQTNVQTSIAPTTPGALNGTVLLPSGQPAAGAQVGFTAPKEGIWLMGSKLSRPTGQDITPIVLSDAQGRFSLPAMESADSLIAAHDGGYCKIEKQDLKTPLVIRLEAWGQIEGMLHVGKSPGAYEAILVNMDNLTPHSPMLGDRSREADEAGRFVFEHLPPGKVRLEHMIRFGNDRRTGSGATHALVKPGEVTKVEMGGDGRQVIGRAVKGAGAAFDWYQAQAQLHGSLPNQTPFFCGAFADDGSFRVDDVPPGTYTLAINISSDRRDSHIGDTSWPAPILTNEVTVPELSGGQSDAPFDVGTLHIGSDPNNAPTKTPPAVQPSWQLSSNMPSATEEMGRTVIGKLLIPAAVRNPPNKASLPPSRWYVGFANPATHPRFANGRAAEYTVDVNLYRPGWELRPLRPQMDLDGTFRVENVPAGRWWLLAQILRFDTNGFGKVIGTAGRTVVVPEIPEGGTDQPMDLGTVEPVMVHSPQIGESAALIEVQTEDGGTFKLADHRGQFVLLDFELMDWDDQQNKFVEAAWAAFGKDARLAMLTLKVPPTSSFMYSTNFDRASAWPLTRLRILPWYELQPLRASFGLQLDMSFEPGTNLPAIFLVGPDGKIVARDLHGDAIKAAISEALEKK